MEAKVELQFKSAKKYSYYTEKHPQPPPPFLNFIFLCYIIYSFFKLFFKNNHRSVRTEASWIEIHFHLAKGVELLNGPLQVFLIFIINLV